MKQNCEVCFRIMGKVEERTNKKIDDLEFENKRLKKELRKVKNKLSSKNIELNKWHHDNFESVDFSDLR